MVITIITINLIIYSSKFQGILTLPYDTFSCCAVELDNTDTLFIEELSVTFCNCELSAVGFDSVDKH